MLYILHGENTDQIGGRSQGIIAGYVAKGFMVKRLDDWGKMTGEKLREETQTDNLFGGKTLIVSEHLHSLPMGKRRTGLIDELSELYRSGLVEDLLLIEKKKLTALMLKKFSGAKVELFEPSKLMWRFLGNLDFNDYQTLIEKEGLEPFYILAMVNRQINLLIQVKSEHPMRMAPWQMRSLEEQARKFSLKQLLAARHELVEIEYRAKTQSKEQPLEYVLGRWIYSLPI
ncbi:hypothetical protein FWH30_02640 [Microgenomates group bacterium]|nr:hypothetical protein [Microgenomates group bacterium]